MHPKLSGSWGPRKVYNEALATMGGVGGYKLERRCKLNTSLPSSHAAADVSLKYMPERRIKHSEYDTTYYNAGGGGANIRV